MRVKKSIGAMGAFLVAAVLFASFGSGRASADETCVVVRQIAPVMKTPGPYTTVENGRGVEMRDDIEACVYYGSRVTVAPVTGKHAAKWVALKYEGTMLGYIEKNAIAPFPAYDSSDPGTYSVRTEKLELFLLPGKHPAAKYSAFFLPRGVAVTGIGKASAAGKDWILLRFTSVGASEENPEPADVQTRYAWALASDLTRLGASYVPDLSKVDESRIPSQIMTEQDAGMKRRVDIGKAERAKLVAHGFYVDPKPVILETLEVDDLVESYPRVRDHTTPLFITADLGLHTFHLLFDRMLQKVEERHFAPSLATLLGLMKKGLANMTPALAANDAGKVVASVASDYLDVAAALLTGKGALSPRGRTEVDRILAAKEKKRSTLSGRDEDYTLYRPRGHYALTPELGRYFRAMSFLGGVTFGLKAQDEAAALRNTGVIAVLCALLDDPATLAAWKSVFDPFTELVGASNDNSWYDYGPVVKKGFAPDAPGDAERMRALNRALLDASRPPLIIGVPAPRTGASQKEREEDAIGFRFIGRRFTFDAMAFNMLTSPQTGTDEKPRNLPDPLDVMAVLGSPAARLEARAFEGFAKYGENLKKLREAWGAFPGNPLSANVYSRLLRIFSEYFEPTGSGQFFAKSPNWEYRKLVAASAAWAELKHDTILYGEQSGAEMGDGGDVWYAPDFLFPEPRGYVEPQPKLFDALASCASGVAKFLSNAGITDEEYAGKLATFADLMKRLAAIAGKETTGGEITADDYRFVREFPCELSRELLLPEDMQQLYPPVAEDVRDRLRMALVADVASDYLAGRALHVATGTPRYIHVFVDDPWGGPRVTRGAVFSFYSFARPLASGRMDDAAWKKLVYGKDQKALDALRPAWTRKPEN